jgi:small subunit ribosomal protein S16
MAVKLRLKRMGRSNAAFYRLNAIDSRSPRDGRVIEELGYYDPRNKDQAKQFVAKLDRCKHWLDVGAVPSGTVSSLLKKSGGAGRRRRRGEAGGGSEAGRSDGDGITTEFATADERG